MPECGCKVQGVETVGGPADGALIGTLIVYCPLHKAAPDMLEVLKVTEKILSLHQSKERGRTLANLSVLLSVRETIARAEGKE